MAMKAEDRSRGKKRLDMVAHLEEKPAALQALALSSDRGGQRDVFNGW
jgi:hypothetical protein